MNANLYAILHGRFTHRLDAVALVTPAGERWTYADIDRESARLASCLREMGAEIGDRVAVQVEKSPQALFLYLACVRAGLVYLPLNTAYSPRELDFFLGDSRPRVVVCRPEALETASELAGRHGLSRVLGLDADGGGSLIEASRDASSDFETVESREEDPASILYTSGTTGRPKGATLSHRNLSSNALTLHEVWGFRGDDVLLHALPLFHTHGLFVACHCSLLNATAMILMPKFDARQVSELLPRASVFMGVPTFYTRLLADPEFGREQTAHMRLFVSGSAPLLEQTAHDFLRRTGHAILERYGMTEVGMATSNPLDGERKPGSVGLPLPGVSLRIAGDDDRPLPPGEIGEIELKGPNVFLGYWGLPEKTAEEFTADGYFRTGDLGTMDEEGYVSIVGRSKDLIISGGYNVYPKEVEVLIDQLDGVAESAVFGLPDPDFGERVAGAVVRKSGAEALDQDTIIERLKSELASYKVPKQIAFVEELPRNAMGKVQKNALREMFTET